MPQPAPAARAAGVNDAPPHPQRAEGDDAVGALAYALRSTVEGDGDGLCLATAHLVCRHLRFDAGDPHWHDRDRVVIEPALAGLGRALCAVLGMDDGMLEQAGPAVGCGAGLALAERMLAARFGRSLVDHRAWVLCTGVDLATGPVQEAVWLAGAWRLGRLTVIASVGGLDAPGLAGFAANGWTVRHAPADDPGEVGSAVAAALRSQKPTLIACIGQGARAAAEMPAGMRGDAGAAGAAAGHRLAGVRRAWLKRLARHVSRQDFERAVSDRLPAHWHIAFPDLAQSGMPALSTAMATRQALAAIAPCLPELAMLPGDPAWPAPAHQTEPPAAATMAAGRLAGGMGGVLYGTALHGGVLPICAQPAACLESALPGLRLAASRGTRLVQVFMEPEPGAQQEGRRAGLRAVRNLFVFRPGDAAEAWECCAWAFRRQGGPSVLLLSETLVPVPAGQPGRTRIAHGAHVAADGPGRRDLTLIASGPELSLALRVRTLLMKAGFSVAVISLPCWDLFALADAGWREGVLGDAPRIGLEPGSGFGWERWLGPGGLFIPTEGIGDDHAHVVASVARRYLDGAVSV